MSCSPFAGSVRFRRVLLVLLVALATVAAVSAPTGDLLAGSGEPTRLDRAEDRVVPFLAEKDDSKPSAPEESGSFSTENASSIVNYAFVPSSGTFTPLVGGTSVPAIHQDDASSGVIPIGFEFWYMGVRYTQVIVNSNGWLSFNPAAGAVGAADQRTNSLASGVAGLRPVLAPLWDDHNGATTGLASYQTSGSPGNRVFTFEWLNWRWDWQAAAAVISFQCKLYEGTGRIEFVYRQDATAVSNGSGGASIGISAVPSGSGNYLSLNGTGASPAASSTTDTTNLATKPATGQIYAFIPPAAPAAPSGLNFTDITPSGMTLNWTDNSSGEIGFGILRSTDGVNYTYVSTTNPDATSSVQTGLFPGTTYFWRVVALSEGAASAPASGSQATAPPGEIACAGAGGNWSNPATWSGGGVPTSGDNVTISDGCAVTIDTNAAALNLTVGQGASGLLEFEPSVARTLTVLGSVTIAPGGTFRSGATGTVTTHRLEVGANLTNNGTLDFSTNGNTAGAEIRFNNATDNTFGGSGVTTNLRLLSLNKGTTNASILDVTIPFTVRSAGVDPVGFLAASPFNGTLKLSGSATYSSVVFLTTSYSIPATGGLWLNNPNFTVTGLNGSPTMNGLLRVAQGTFNIGTSLGNTMGAGAGAVFTIEGGTVNIASRLSTASAVTYNQTGGVVNVCTVGNNASTGPSFNFSSTSASNVINMSGGVINLVQINSNATATSRRDYLHSGLANITGGVLNVGTAATAGNAGNFDFRIQGQVPPLVLNNTTNAKNAFLTATANVWGNVTIPTGSTLNLNGFSMLVLGTTATNNGTINGSTTGSRLYFLGGAAPQLYTGVGTVTAPLDGLSIDNPLGVTIDAGIAANIVTLRVNLFRGTLVNTGKVTLGNGGTTTATTQIGSTGLLDPAGSYDGFPVLNLGSGGHNVLYIQEGAPRTTGFEIPASRTVTNVTINNTNHVTLAGGGLTITGASGLTLTAGRFNTSDSNLVTLASTVTTTPTGSATSFVNGPLALQVNTATNLTRNFGIGTPTGWRPIVLGSFHSNGALQTYTARVLEGPTGGTPNPPLVELTAARHYRIQNTANVFSTTTATVQLSYGADDNIGATAAARVAQSATANGAYNSRGGATAASPTTGIVSTSAIVQGDEFFVLASEQPLPTVPANDTCSSPTTLFLDVPVNGWTVLGANDYSAVAGCFTGVGQTASTAPGRDVVYAFTAPEDGSYSFKLTNYDVSQNAVLYIGAGPCGSACTVAANRTVSPSSSSNSNTSEEIYCQPMSAGQQVFAYVDDHVSGNAGSHFRIEVNPCALEEEPNAAPIQASLLFCGIEGAISPAADVDFFSIGAQLAGTRVFAMADGVPMNNNDLRMRITTTADTLEFDDDDNDSPFGAFSPNVAGTPLTGAAAFVRIDHFTSTVVSEPYRLYTVLQPSQSHATAEVEPNNTPATAQASPLSYFYGSAAGSGADLDFYSFSASAGDLVILGLDGDPLRDNTPINTTLALIGIDGVTVLASVNDGGSTSSTTPGTGSLTSTTPNSPGEALTFRVVTSGTYYARVTNTSTSTGDYLLSISRNCVASTDVSVLKGGSPDPVLAGDEITYSISVANNGASAAESLTLSDSTPANTTFVSLVAPGGWVCSTPSVGGTGAITCTAATLFAGSAVDFTLVVKVDTCAASGTITNTATVTVASGDWDPSNNSATANNTVNALNCNDGNPCTADSCNPVLGCVYGPAPDGTACDDGDLCTLTDSCQAGVCTGSNPVSCVPLSQCHEAGVCNPGTGVCSDPPAPSGTACDDANACTTADACDGAGACAGGPPPNCDDGVPCTVDSCNPSSGCINTESDPLCDDGSVCTTDKCDGQSGCSNTPISCDDADACTTDSCNPVLGCANTPLNCDDANPCTTDSCDSVLGCVNTGFSPPGVTGLVAQTSQQYAWDDLGGGFAYDVLRGAVGQLPVGSGPSETCLASSHPANAIIDSNTPAIGAGFYYLVRSEQNGCNGSYGSASNGNPRISSVCP